MVHRLAGFREWDNNRSFPNGWEVSSLDGQIEEPCQILDPNLTQIFQMEGRDTIGPGAVKFFIILMAPTVRAVVKGRKVGPILQFYFTKYLAILFGRPFPLFNVNKRLTKLICDT